MPLTQTPPESASSISITDLLIHLPSGIGLSAFSLPSQPCQVLVTITCHLLPHCLKPSKADKDGVIDDWDTLGLGKSVNYSALGKSLSKCLQEADTGKIKSLESLVDVAVGHVVEEYPSSLNSLDVKIERRRALLFSSSVSVSTSVDLVYPELATSTPSPSSDEVPNEDQTSPNYTNIRTTSRLLKISGIEADTIIGLNPHERVEKQRLELDLELDLLRLFTKDTEGEEKGGRGFDYKSWGLTAHSVRPPSAHGLECVFSFS